MRKLFEGKVVLITGAGSGIGQAAAVAYASHGATIIVSDKEISETVSMIKSKRREAYFLEADVTNIRDCGRLIKRIIEKYGRLDIAFNSPGISGESDFHDEMSAERFNRVISNNLCGIFYCMKYEIQAMLHQGGGIIINSPGFLAYEKADSFIGFVAAIHGIIGLTQNAALKYANENIRIHCVTPEFLHTPLIETINVKTNTASSLLPLRSQSGKAKEIAATVLWLSSGKESALTTGYYPGEGYSSSN